MRKNQREPINQKYLIISIIGVVIFAILLSVFTLKTPVKTTSKVANKPKTEYKAIKESLNQQFNQNGHVATIKEEHDINDSTSKHPPHSYHCEIDRQTNSKISQDIFRSRPK